MSLAGLRNLVTQTDDVIRALPRTINSISSPLKVSTNSKLLSKLTPIQKEKLLELVSTMGAYTAAKPAVGLGTLANLGQGATWGVIRAANTSADNLQQIQQMSNMKKLMDTARWAGIGGITGGLASAATGDDYMEGAGRGALLWGGGTGLAHGLRGVIS